MRPGQNPRRTARTEPHAHAAGAGGGRLAGRDAASRFARIAGRLSGSSLGVALGALSVGGAPDHDPLAFRLGADVVASAVAGARSAVRFLSLHTGLPALLVAAVLIAIGYRVLKRTARFALQVVAIAAALLTACHLGWIRW